MVDLPYLAADVIVSLLLLAVAARARILSFTHWGLEVAGLCVVLVGACFLAGTHVLFPGIWSPSARFLAGFATGIITGLLICSSILLLVDRGHVAALRRGDR